MTKILLLGSQGQLGWALQRAFAPLGQVFAYAGPRSSLVAHAVDVTDPDALRQVLLSVAPDVILNATAYTHVDRAEENPQHAHAVNAVAPAQMAALAEAIGAWLVHFSTDYVFDGCGDHFRDEMEATRPLNVYGRTKRAGEEAVLASGCRHVLLRTSWVYAARGRNFPKTILAAARQRDRLSVVDDQIGAPTSAELLADVTAHVVRGVLSQPALGGLYHVAASGATSWWDYARFVLDWAQRHGYGENLMATPERVLPVSSDVHASAAPRPLNSRLSTRKLRDTFGLLMPDWEQGVERMLTELLEPR